MTRRRSVLVAVSIGIVALVALAAFTLNGSTPTGGSSSVQSGSSSTYSTASSLLSRSSSSGSITSSSQSSISSSSMSSSTASSQSSTTTVGTLTFSGTWSNLRGVAYPWEPLTLNPDQRGSPDPEWSFQQFRILGWNLVRMDRLSWGQYQNDSSRFITNLNRVISAANANGIYVIWEFATFPSSAPTDVRSNFADTGQYWAWWWNDGTYNGNQPSLQGLPAWQAFFKGFLKPVVTLLDSQPCTLGYKFANEPAFFPSSNSDSYLSAYYASIGSQIRALGSTRYLVYEGPGAHPGSVDLINSIQSSMSSGNYRPAIYDVHYPQASGISSDGPLAAKNNVAFWDGEDFASYVIASGYMQSFVQNGAASTIYRWDEDGNLLASGTGTTPGTITSGAYNLSNQQTQVLGAAKFFA